MPLNDDPNALTDEEYWSQYNDFVMRHPDSFHEIPADQYELYEEEV